MAEYFLILKRPEHFMMETWNPLGTFGVITAFNFPNAVFACKTAIFWTCGDAVSWKGAPSSSLVTISTAKIIGEVRIQKEPIIRLLWKN